MTNPQAGREDSVTAAFHQIIFQEAITNGKTEAIFPLSGADRYYNADALFRAHDMFILIESKSYERNIRDESKKDSACSLCLGLIQNHQMALLHQQCHFIMWGLKRYQSGLDLLYSVYRRAVCNIQTLPDCKGLGPAAIPKVESARDLAKDLLSESIGLGKPDFFNYLDWLLHVRSGGNSNDGLPTTLYATSHAGGITSMSFTSLSQLAAWAAPGVAAYFNQPKKPRP